MQLTPMEFLKTIFNDKFFADQSQFVEQFVGAFKIKTPSSWNYLFTCSKITKNIQEQYLNHLRNENYVKLDWIDNYELVKALIRYDYHLLCYLNNTKIALKLISGSVDYCPRFQFFKEELKNNREFVLKVADLNGLAYMYFSTSLQNDREILLTAVSCNPYAIKYVQDKTLLLDKEIAKAAIKRAFQPDDVMKYFDKSLWDDKQFVLSLLNMGAYRVYLGLKIELQNDEDIKAAIVSKCPSLLKK